MSSNTRRWHLGVGRSLVVAGLALALGGCATVTGSPGSSPTPAPGCHDAGDSVDLGAAFPDAAPTFFTTGAGQVQFEAIRFSHSQPLDPAVGRTQLLLGPADHPPRYDAATGTVSNVSHRLDLVEATPAVLDLPAGRYWMVNTNGVWIVARGCSTDVGSVQ